MRVLALIAVSAVLAAGPLSAADGESYRDAVTRIRPGSMGMLPGSGAWVPVDKLQYVPPATAKGVHNAFWSTVYELERKHVAYGYRHGRQQLVEAIRDDLARLSTDSRLETMRRFLRVTHHFRGKADANSTPEIRSFHRQRFEADVREFADFARREFVERRNRAYLDFFSHIRALASAGPEGLRLSQELASIDPENAQVMGNLAQDLMNSGDYKGAAEVGEKAIRLDPQNSQPYTALASAKYHDKDYDSAFEAASAALRIDPGDTVAFSIMKLAKNKVGYSMGAEGEAQRQAVERREQADTALETVEDEERSLRVGLQPSGGEHAVKQASEYLARQARVELNKGDYDKAVLLATEALSKDPAHRPALFRRALANLKRERLQESLADTTRALELYGASPSPILLSLHSQVLNRIGRYQESLESAERGLQIGPGSDRYRGDLLFQKAHALAGLHRNAEAKQVLGKAARLSRAYVPYYQEALDLPEEADLARLFSRDLSQDYRKAGALEKKAPGDRRMFIILIFSVLGGFLIALGLLHITAPRKRAKAAAAVEESFEEELISGTYRLEEKIGSGGMGVVYKALDVNLERRVAIKKMRDEIINDPRERQRFLSEARTVASLKHPNIVEIHSVVGSGSDIFLVFEYVDGHTVDEYIRAYKKIPYEQAVRIIQGIAAALEYAHSRGVIHRDLKPSNVMITREGQVKVMDFGVARQAKDSLSNISATNTITGTPPYMAPEQEQGMVRRESDIYAMAVCFYEMLTGELPFPGTAGGMMLNKVNRNYVRASKRVSGLHIGVDQVLDWALEPDPDKRCTTANRLVRHLEALS